MAINDPRFSDQESHRKWLAEMAQLPAGFRVATSSFSFLPQEADKPGKMDLTLITSDVPSTDFAAVFTKNAFPGAPVIVGRQRLEDPSLGAILVNNKISNVCAPDGVETVNELCASVADVLNLKANQVLTSSTGIIGWRLPKDDMIEAIPQLVQSLKADSILPAAKAIMTTDLFPKVRRVDLPGGGSIVGIAKGAGMVEPNLATMLVYILTDLKVGRDSMRQALKTAVNGSFNAISIDSDQSTSDTVVCWSSCAGPEINSEGFTTALIDVCENLAEDLVRNGEGVRHVQRVTVSGCPSQEVARAVGKALINAPLWKCALAGNDPNVGRIVQAVGDELGNNHPEVDASKVTIDLGRIRLFENGVFQLDPQKEEALSSYLTTNQLYATKPAQDGLTFTPPVTFPPHGNCVDVHIDLNGGPETFTVTGNDLTHEYVTENADYRS